MRVIYIYWGTGPSWKFLPGAEKNAGSLNYLLAYERGICFTLIERSTNIMATNQIVELKSLVMTSKDNNEIVERLKSFLEKMSKEKRVNWQMLACYLDGKIFEFIQANKDNEVVMKFATELVEELAEQFNLTRNL